MWFNVRTVDDPIISAAILQHVLELLLYKFRRIWKHCNVICSLQIIKRYMIINSMASAFFSLRQGRNPRIMIPLSSRHHFPKSVVCPDFDHILRKFQISLLIQLHRFSIQVCTADCIRQTFFHQLILYADQLPHELSSCLRCRIGRIILPERPVSLPTKSQIPHYIQIFLFFHCFLPEFLKFFSMYIIRCLQIRIRPCKHLCPQWLCMMVCNKKAHIRSHIAIQSGILIRSRNNHISAASKQCFQSHFPGLFFFIVDFPFF